MGAEDGDALGATDGAGSPEAAGSVDGEGATDGDALGATDGAGSPEAAGSVDGEGATDGDALGATDGAGSPEAAGSVDGDGATDGAGSLEGAGSTVGAGAVVGGGAGVGSAVGATVALTDGAGVGSSARTVGTAGVRAASAPATTSSTPKRRPARWREGRCWLVMLASTSSWRGVDGHPWRPLTDRFGDRAGREPCGGVAKQPLGGSSARLRPGWEGAGGRDVRRRPPTLVGVREGPVRALARPAGQRRWSPSGRGTAGTSRGCPP